MVAALFYLQFHSLKNRTLVRLKRLKRPKYLLGGIVGALYFYFYFFRFFFKSSSQGRSLALTPEGPDLVLYECLGALVLFTLALLAWLLPRDRAALAFTEAEIAFLFPAPISRRGLIHYKLLRSQAAILFTTLLLTFMSHRFAVSGWFHVAGWWIALSVLNLHTLGASFARTMLLDRGITNWQRRAAILTVIALAGVAVWIWARRTLPALDLENVQNAGQLKDYALQLLSSGPVPYLLYPFRVLVRPYLAQDAATFFPALVPAIVLLGLHYWWVIRSDVAFEEASIEVSRKVAEKVAAIRSGNYRAATGDLKPRRPLFALRPGGPSWVAFFWKNLISAGAAFTPRVWIVVAAIALGVSFGVGRGAGSAGLSAGLAAFAGVMLIWTLLIGPQLLRQDLRQDLAMMDVLKAYPMSGWQVVTGQLLAPVAILTVIQWILAAAAVLLLRQWHLPGLSVVQTWVGAAGVALLLPLLNLVTTQIPNAAVLLFPAWFQTGKESPQGFEATGQRLIFFLGQTMVLLLALLPVGFAFGLVLFLVRLALGDLAGMLAGFLAAGAVFALEAALGIYALGIAFERFDLSLESEH